MRNKNSLTLAMAVAALASLSAKADIIAYDNSTNFENLFTDRGNLQLGDEVYLSNGADVTMTDFKFEYTYQPAAGHSGATGTVRFYSIVAGAPGPQIGPTSATFTLTSPNPDASHSIDIPNLSVLVPTGALVWTVDFAGLQAGDHAGLRFYNGVGVGGAAGQSFDDHWENLGTVAAPTWARANNTDLIPGGSGQVIDNFGAIVTIVPEPGTIGLLVAGGALLGLASRRRKA
jgi:hypothetical protein